MPSDPSSDGSAFVISYLGTFAPEPSQDAESAKPTFDFDLDPFPGLISKILSSIFDTDPDAVHVTFFPVRGIFPHCRLHTVLLSEIVNVNYCSPKT
jgi:hypothetical protein